MSLSYNTEHPVLVTGATGYVAGWLIQRLLDEGFTVHAAMRNPDDARKRAHLDEMAEGAKGEIKYFHADLLDDGSFSEAMQSCEVVFHTASPFTMKYEDPQRDLIDPALNGTQNVLKSVNEIPTVKRVVLTSSIAAVRGGGDDQRNAPDGVLDESVWNTQSNLDDGPYAYSKTLAEREAWRMADGQDRWRLVVVNPGLVVGPGKAPTQTSASFDFLRQIGDGTFKEGTPPVQLPAVDVRDVAEAHFRAGFETEAEGRHLTFERPIWLGEIADMLEAEFGERFDWPKERPTSSDDPEFKADNSKLRERLGVEPRDVAPGIKEMFQKMIDVGDVVRQDS
ncbi:NAD-dependent epimerase/dehydratase family protein [Histidinibacterium aquaticum]|uniref:NAD-dependent epimerase/dehydratase family protein n=1 Tax=Histidinibacterium aquaticum TaxID=2613962 RepID=A0A5J5GSC4_9RHOB|nr:NAD-dependent epimerase/dehydratase family protein [Histidinibacterium aquaticum]KAA9010444.1 NAD-dependent epimerase/dehydratase family protein [Histidinibacterium aquaticum]